MPTAWNGGQSYHKELGRIPRNLTLIHSFTHALTEFLDASQAKDPQLMEGRTQRVPSVLTKKLDRLPDHPSVRAIQLAFSAECNFP